MLPRMNTIIIDASKRVTDENDTRRLRQLQTVAERPVAQALGGFMALVVWGQRLEPHSGVL